MDSEPHPHPQDEPSVEKKNQATEDQPIEIVIKFTPASATETWSFPAAATLDTLLHKCEDAFPDHDWTQSKAMVEFPRGRPRPAGVKALLKASDDGATALSPLHGAALKLLAPKATDLAGLRSAASAASARAAAHAGARQRGVAAHPARRSPATAQADAQYAFHTIRPLPHLPDPARSRAMLERLASDAGIRSAMRAHRFSVGLLTEMDPAAHTAATHEGTTRILGLNRNRGEVVELRLRTDAGDGYRNYRDVRKTLCHELAHNVFGEHDSEFWELCRRIEREVERGDWRSGGRSVGGEEYAPEREGALGGRENEVVDHGGWTGGEFVLGGGERRDGGGGGGSSEQQLSRREILAQAAEARAKALRKADEADHDAGQQGGRGS